MIDRDSFVGQGFDGKNLGGAYMTGGLVPKRAVQCLTSLGERLKRPLGCDLEHACASKGTFSGRLYDVVTDVFSNWPLDTLECEGSDKLHLKLFVGIALFAAEATCTKLWLRLHMRIRPRNFSVASSCCHDP